MQHGVWQAWEDGEGGVVFAPRERCVQWQQQGLLLEPLRLLHEIVAGNGDQAMAIHFQKMGYEPTKTVGEPRPLANERGELYYPKGLGDFHCRNCGATHCGDYCHQCGQQAVHSRLSFGEILRELPNKIFNLERGLWFTFLALWTRPGQVCADYVHGRRRPYVNPISYFLIGASTQLLSLYFSAPIIRQAIATSIQDARKAPGQEKIFERMDAQIGGDTATFMANVYLTVIAQAYTYLALIAFCCPLGLALWWLHRRTETRYYFAEAMVFALYVIGQGLIFTAFVTPVVGRVSTMLQMIMAQGFYFGFALWAHAGFFPSNWAARSRTGLAMIFAMSCFFLAIICLTMVSWTANLIWLRLATVD